MANNDVSVAINTFSAKYIRLNMMNFFAIIQYIYCMTKCLSVHIRMRF